jgi:acyl carrier protein
MLGPLVSSAADEGLPSLRYLTAGSERLTRANAAAVQRLLAPDAKLVQTYGSTEAARICINVLEDPVQPGDSPLPVGVAVAGKRVQVLAPDGSPAGPGATGEIVITSRYLSYYWDPASAGQGAPSTEERAAAWTLRTGDLGMIDDDGLLVLLGREDRMVKIRGHRVELDMVERALLALDLVHEAVVLDEPGGSDTRRLVAHVVLREPASPGEIAHLRRVLGTRLPAYMVPSRIVVLEELPLLPNGKVDVRGLAAASASSAPDGGVPALSETLTESEELLVGIWSSALECERVGREEDFFELGGDSLTAAVIAAGVHHAFGVELELSSFTNAPNVATMAPLLDELRVAGETWERPALTRVPREQPLPLSYAQERTWQISRTPEKSAGYVMARRLLIEGRLDLDALRRSVDHIVRRHETLRSSFSERDGQPVQVVHPPAPVNLPVDDFSASHDPEARSAELLLREARMPFDLEQGPLLRLRLVRIGDARYHLLRVHHHIIADAWSWMVFYRELGVLYEAYHAGDPPPLPDDLPVQYSDFAVWERGYLRPDSPRYQRDLAWWRRLFQDAPPTMPLPFRRAEPCLSARPADGLIWWGLPTEVSRGLDRVGRRVGATFFMVRLAVFAAALALDTNSQDVILGVYMTNRRRAETQAMFGLFANLVTLRLEFGRSLTFCDWLARVRSVVIETSCRAEIPYAQLSEQLHRDGSPPPEIRTIFGLADQAPVQRFGDLEITGLRPSFPVMPWEFSLTMDRWLEADGCSAVFDARVHDPDGVRSFIAGFQHLAGAVAAHPDRLLGSARI